MRLFIGLPFENSSRPAIARLQLEAQHCIKMTPVAPGNLHMTVKFIGDAESDKKGDIIRVLEGLKSSLKPFSIDLRGVGVLPSPQKPNVLLIRMADDSAMTELMKTVAVALEKAGFLRETNEIKPHLTIGRIKFVSDKRAFQGFLLKHSKDSFGEMRVNTLVLYESILQSEGPVYKKHYEMRFGE